MDNFDHIKTFLFRFKKLSPPHEAAKKTTQQAIKEITKINIPENDITISRNIVFINTNSILKNEIFINKKQILANITKEFGDKKIKDIK